MQEMRHSRSAILDRWNVWHMLGCAMTLTLEEINEVEAFISSCELSTDQVTNEYRKEQLLALCRMAILAANSDQCLHRWEKDGLVPRCAKCGAVAGLGLVR